MRASSWHSETQEQYRGYTIAELQYVREDARAAAQAVISGSPRQNDYPYVGKRVGIVRTGTGVATVTGSAVVGRAIAVNEKEFNDLRSEHLVPRGSTFDIEKGATKYLYPLVNCKQIKQRPVPKGSLGIIARQI